MRIPMLSIVVPTMVLVPTICILLYLHSALEVEALANHRRLAELAGGYLDALRERMSVVMMRGAADAAVLLDEQGRVRFPEARPAPGRSDDHPPTRRGRELAARVGELLESGAVSQATELIEAALADVNLVAVDRADGRNLLAELCAAALEAMPPAAPGREALAQALAASIRDWESPLPPSQRLELARRLERIEPDLPLPPFTGLAMALAYVAAHPAPPAVPGTLQPTGTGQLWHMISTDRRRIQLLHESSIRGRVREALRTLGPREGLIVELIAPGATARQPGDVLASIALAPPLAGWLLRMTDAAPTAPGRRASLLVWSSMLGIGLVVLAALGVTRLLVRQMDLTAMKNSLATNITHELRTPLAGMMVLVETIEDGRVTDPDQLRQYVGLIGAECRRLGRLVDNVLRFASIERGGEQVSRADVELEEVVERAAKILGDRLEAPSCRFNVHVDDDIPLIRGDESALVSVLVNLLDNALKYSGDPRVIDLSVTRAGDRAVLTVTDHGPGIRPEDRERVFERFHRGDEGLSGQPGCGLGLAIVKEIVEGHGGSIVVEGPPGATFRVCLPCEVGDGDERGGDGAGVIGP